MKFVQNAMKKLFKFLNFIITGTSTYHNEPVIEDLLSILKNEVSNRKNKNVEILHLASNICRRMQGKLNRGVLGCGRGDTCSLADRGYLAFWPGGADFHGAGN